MRIGFSLFVLLACVLPFSANAQVKDKAFKDWAVYSTELQGKKICYIASFPTGKTGNYKKRDQPYFLVTKIGQGVFEVSASSGFDYKVKSDISLDIQGNKYKMFTKGDLAWAADNKQDNKIIEFMRKKNSMSVRGTSLKGTYAVDKYSLAGFGAAFDRMNDICS
ncbi:MAG: uncharacterized protein K0R98_259 [Rickettsiaceae bacterium]|nr:uncharacterized protein [Rickettsiaceae bacterium]